MSDKPFVITKEPGRYSPYLDWHCTDGFHHGIGATAEEAFMNFANERREFKISELLEQRVSKKADA